MAQKHKTQVQNPAPMSIIYFIYTKPASQNREYNVHAGFASRCVKPSYKACLALIYILAKDQRKY